MELGPVHDGLVPRRDANEVVGVDSGGDILDDCLYVPLGGHLVVAVRACRLVEAVVV
jgi:hypothetical protein